jgi:hypothetical protein
MGAAKSQGGTWQEVNVVACGRERSTRRAGAEHPDLELRWPLPEKRLLPAASVCLQHRPLRCPLRARLWLPCRRPLLACPHSLLRLLLLFLFARARFRRCRPGGKRSRRRDARCPRPQARRVASRRCEQEACQADRRASRRRSANTTPAWRRGKRNSPQPQRTDASRGQERPPRSRPSSTSFHFSGSASRLRSAAHRITALVLLLPSSIHIVLLAAHDQTQFTFES